MLELFQLRGRLVRYEGVLGKQELVVRDEGVLGVPGKQV